MVCVCARVCVCVYVNMLVKLRLHNESDFMTSKFATPTFLRRSYRANVSTAKDKEDFIYLFVYYRFI